MSDLWPAALIALCVVGGSLLLKQGEQGRQVLGWPAIGLALWVVWKFGSTMEGPWKSVMLLGLSAGAALSFLLMLLIYPRSNWKIARDEEEEPSEGEPTYLFEQDGRLLYRGKLEGLAIVVESQGVLTLDTGDGGSFRFPRVREFHDVISRIQDRSTPG